LSSSLCVVGMLIRFTPCVFPVIPIELGFNRRPDAMRRR